mmetsp:Transcript_3956/g.5221  ORF Transcript_3956/g.5221 Transcript_3956/m.5221 type:complete len:327 (+) Transcript_3956:48-1028(+)
MGNFLTRQRQFPSEDFPAGFGRDYGDGRVPLSLKKAQISSELLQYLRSNCDIFSATESQILENESFEKCIDYPAFPNHRYYEGYLHGENTSLPVNTLNPRYGQLMSKKAAPIALRALCECVRRKLNPSLIKELSKGKNNENENDEEKCVFTEHLLKLIQDGKAFSDLAIQIHAGDAITEKNIGWHTDAPNSILHMALTIGHGVRALHSKRYPTTELMGKCNDVVEWQTPGNVYISSPSCFQHAVQYEKALLWSNRILAIQVRLPQSDDQLVKTALNTDGKQYKLLMEKIQNALSIDFIMPTLDEVKEVELELELLKQIEMKTEQQE